MKRAFRGASYESQNQFLKTNGIIIDFITYANPRNKEIIGLSLRVIANDKITITFLGTSSENRIQKIMFLLSRGLLKSPFHWIKQKSILIELE